MNENDESDEQKAARLKRDIASGTERLVSTPPAPFIKGEAPLCAFCGRGKGEYRHLIAGPKVNICDACVAKAKQQIDGGDPSS